MRPGQIYIMGILFIHVARWSFQFLLQNRMNWLAMRTSDMLGTGSLLAASDSKFDSFTWNQLAIVSWIRNNSCLVNKDIFTTIIQLNKAESLFRIKPFHMAMMDVGLGMDRRLLVVLLFLGRSDDAQDFFHNVRVCAAGRWFFFFHSMRIFIIRFELLYDKLWQSLTLVSFLDRILFK
mmetsp:Transcript_132345/g.382600  ORF Transcript_132345/g.382600 Transcript_132345/m.382600 type:complete len:178 (-) Transcript_132345:317-850(-)